MATTCRTSDGDMLDVICHNVYGHLNGSTEAVLDANQGLADEPQPYRAGVNGSKGRRLGRTTRVTGAGLEWLAKRYAPTPYTPITTPAP